MNNHKWYILRVVSGQEKKVKSYIERDLVNHGLEDYVPQILTPTEKVYQMRKSKDGKSKKIAVERQFYPGYVMVQANLEDNNSGEVIFQLKNVPGVLGFLDVDGTGANAMPKPMRETEVNRILGKVEETDEFEIQHDTQFTEGESVKVMDGPFSGFTGTVEEVFDDRKKLNVMVKIFGRSTPIELNYIQVSKVE